MTIARILVCAAAIACSRAVDSPPAPTASAGPSGAAAAADQLDRIDGRSPIPLLPTMASHQKQNMRDHLAAVQEIVAALAIADFSSVEAAAARIGFSPTMGQMCTHMGAGAPGFSEQALEFHHTADRIGAAAREHDPSGVLMTLSATLQACTSCHAVWKQQVVDEATWQRLAASLTPSGPH
jgi:hypothetical protein